MMRGRSVVARAALGLAMGVMVAAAAAQAPAAAVDAAGAGRRLQGLPTDSHAITFEVGHRFIGPGIVSAGWIGAKRQVIIPPGEWLVLAAFDRQHGTMRSTQVTTLAFGQFGAAGLASLMTVSFHSRPMGGTALTSRLEASTECPAAAAGALHHAQERVRRLDVCSLLRAATDADRALAFAPGLPDRLRPALARLGTGVEHLAFRSDVHITNTADLDMAYVRLDAPQWFSADAAAAAPAPRGGTGPEARVAWLKRFATTAALGYDRRHDLDDLEDGVRPEGAGLDLAP